MAGGARAAEREPRRGRHRRGSGESTWTPVVTGRRALAEVTADLPRVVTRPVRGPREPVAYAWPETPATGLRKFNLGTIPASVTPPATWRRAAWFAVGTAVFVVLALGFAAFRLVGSPRKSTTIDALPGQPSQQLLITDLPGTDGTSPSRVAPTTSTRSSGPRTTRPRQAPPAAVPGQPHHSGGTTGGPARPAVPDHRESTTAPARSTVAAAPKPPTDPEQMGDYTEQYYAQVADNPAAAYELTAGPMRAEGPEGIEQRYGDVESVQVKEITIDPNWSYTRSVLVITREDGSTVTVERELTFSPGPNPRITGDTAAS